MSSSEPVPTTFSAVAQSFRRPYPANGPLFALVLLVPFYIFIPFLAEGHTLHTLDTKLDRALPLVPEWALVYGVLYGFLIVLPFFITREEQHVRSMLYAYLTVWLTSYVVFIAYPTVAPRPMSIAAPGFAAAGLRFLYDADPPRNCFPSLHVAHSFVSAFACLRVHRAVGTVAMFCAAMVALSTLFTKQHYAVDVIAGFLLALVASVIFLRRCSRETIPDADRCLAPMIAVGTLAFFGLTVPVIWAAYLVLHR